MWPQCHPPRAIGLHLRHTGLRPPTRSAAVTAKREADSIVSLCLPLSPSPSLTLLLSLSPSQGRRCLKLRESLLEASAVVAAPEVQSGVEKQPV